MKRTVFGRVLVANRGEIALRVIRGLREMEIESIAVFSHIDRNAPFVKQADYAYCIGEPEPLKSYLDKEKILAVAERAGAKAIHPGYGFLAENPEFATMCRERGIVFIGPNPDVISLMGDKIAARTLAKKLEVPLIPGMEQPSESKEELKHFASEIGYPLLIKAAYGGGGKGMRAVFDEKDLERSLESAMNEAYSAFGNSTIYLEKLIQEPRHIEVQVVCDHFGHGIYFPERECSIQRRHQKLVEETPSTAVHSELRKKIGETAVALALTSGYDSVGTVEFLMDRDRNFYFLEMNTRLQVEHPVTEMISGVDLFKWQVKIAADRKLPMKQEHILCRGAAIECRICAEDPFNNFLPASGTVSYLYEPAGPGVRVDSGIETGSEVALFYDSLLAKLVCWGYTREEAIARTRRALAEYSINGVKTTIPFHRLVMQSAEFRSGTTTTDFIDRYLKDLIGGQEETAREEETLAAVAAALGFLDRSGQTAATAPEKKKKSAWRYTSRGWK